MKRKSKFITLLSVAWIIGVAVRELGSLVGANIRPLPSSLQHVSWLLKPSNVGRYTWTTVWLLGVGIALVLIAAAFAEGVKRDAARREGSEA